MSETVAKYSQREEEEHILAAVGSKVGRFLDIGAWNARDLSNTRALYELGWGGVMVEPSPEPFLGLVKEYGNESKIQLICAAVGFERTMTKIYASADALSTTSEDSYEKWKESGGFYGCFFTPVITIPDILNQFGAFDFVSIDTEGTSVDLFNALLDTQMRPAAICVEHDNRIVECSQRAQAEGYRVAYMSGENLVFARPA